MFNVGSPELLVILMVALIVLGPNKLPEVARQVGKAMGEIRRLSAGFQAELRDAMEEAIPSKPWETPTTTALPVEPAVEPAAPAATADATVTLDVPDAAELSAPPEPTVQPEATVPSEPVPSEPMAAPTSTVQPEPPAPPPQDEPPGEVTPT